MSFKDHFSKHGPKCSQFRPIRPPELFPFLKVLGPVTELSGDCGNRQPMIELQSFFKNIIARYAFWKQIGRALPKPKFPVTVGAAESNAIASSI